MKCFVCDAGSLVRQLAAVEGQVKGSKYAVDTMALVCDHCGHIAMEGEDTPEFLRKVSDAYRAEHKLLTSSEIRAIRGGLSQQRFADELGIGVATVKRCELGLVQNKSTDKLIREFARRNTPVWTYETPSYKEACLAAASGLWAHAHGPPNEPGCANILSFDDSFSTT